MVIEDTNIVLDFYDVFTLATIKNRNVMHLVLCLGYISILDSGIGIYLQDFCLPHTYHVPTLNHFITVSFRFTCFSLCSSATLSFSHTFFSLSLFSTHSVLSHKFSVCLFLFLSLISILLSMSWRQIGCIQPGSCVLLVLCHNRCSLANPLSICLEELQDALSPETSALRLTRRVLYQKLHSVNTQK